MANRHVIGSQIFQLKIKANEDANALQQSLSNHFWNTLSIAFEKLFDKLAGPKELVRIEKLEIDLGRISSHELFSELLTNRILQELENAISNDIQATPDNLKKQTFIEGRFDLWMYFLEHGFLPPHTTFPKSIDSWNKEILDALAVNSKAINSLQLLLINKPLALERFLLQYDTVFLEKILGIFTAQKLDKLAETVAEITLFLSKIIIKLKESTFKLSQKTSTTETQLAHSIIPHLEKFFPSIKSDFTWKSTFQNWFINSFPQLTSIAESRIPRQLEIYVWRLIVKTVILQGQSPTKKELMVFMSQHPLFTPWQALLSEIGMDNKIPVKAARSWLKAIQSIPAQLIQEIPKSKKSSKLPDPLSAPETEAINQEFDQNQVEKGPELNISKTPIDHEFPTELLPKFQTPFTNPTFQEDLKKGNDTLNKNDQKNQLHAQNQFEIDLPSRMSQTKLNKEYPLDNLSNLESVYSDASFLKKQVEENQPFFINNAGLVLLHPFLTGFYQSQNLMEGKIFKDEASKVQAVILLDYIAMGGPMSQEFSLLLPKFLCGMPLNQPIDRSLKISNESKLDADHMLQAVIENWSALKKSSPELLRREFLQRSGKLEKKQSGWKLSVEKLTHDILLDRLPWNYGIVKLPWMQDILYVDWR